MNWYEAIGFTAVALNVAGNLMLTRKNTRGWTIRILCNVAQLVYSVFIGSPSLAANAVVFAGINVRGIVLWRRLHGHADHCGVARRKPCNCGRFA